MIIKRFIALRTILGFKIIITERTEGVVLDFSIDVNHLLLVETLD